MSEKNYKNNKRGFSPSVSNPRQKLIEIFEHRCRAEKYLMVYENKNGLTVTDENLRSHPSRVQFYFKQLKKGYWLSAYYYFKEAGL